MLFCGMLIFFQNQLFLKILSGISLECQTDWIQIRPDVVSGLIWVQSVCKGSQQTTLVRMELMLGLIMYVYVVYTGSCFFNPIALRRAKTEPFPTMHHNCCQLSSQVLEFMKICYFF